MRSSTPSKGLLQNLGRIQRLSFALNREKEKQLASVQQGAPNTGDESDPSEQINALFEMAETHRNTAFDALTAMHEELNAVLEPGSDVLSEDTAADELHDNAKEAMRAIKELRILFFSIIEHLQDLLEKQTQTRDETVAWGVDNYEKMIQSLLSLSPQQSGHAQRAQPVGSPSRTSGCGSNGS